MEYYNNSVLSESLSQESCERMMSLERRKLSIMRLIINDTGRVIMARGIALEEVDTGKLEQQVSKWIE